MQDLKEILQRIRQKKKQRKEVQTVYKDVLAGSKAYQDVVEDLEKVKAKKLQIERSLMEQCLSEKEKAEKLGLDIKNETQLLSDAALSLFMKGQSIELTDENDVQYEPIFKVAFKKKD
jgi:histidinol dehydrogenase